MKVLKIRVTLTERGFKKEITEYEFEAKGKIYVREKYPRRINKKDLLKITTHLYNKLPGLSIGYETMCLPVNEQEAEILLRKEILKRIGELKDSLDKLLSGMNKVEPETRNAV